MVQKAMLSCIWTIFIFLLTIPADAATGDFEAWLQAQEKISTERMLRNVSPPDAAPGAVVASPEKLYPNYFFHWTRDAALTMNTVVSLWQSATPQIKLNVPPTLRQSLFDRITAYVSFSRQNQLTPTRSGIGEPKFYANGTAFNEDWCRPQNDGPALRAVTLIRFANLMLDRGEDLYVKTQLYDGRTPSQSVIKTDLEFVSNHWRDHNCDIWEEVDGEHFYNKIASRRALQDGAALATRLGDVGAAAWYTAQAQQIEPSIQQHFDAARNIFIPTINRVAGIWYKHSGLDSQVILGVLHAGGFQFIDPRILQTMKLQTESFRNLYPINKVGVSGVGIGRYPEDVYDGDKFQGGNPWVLNTAAFATAYYHAAKESLDNGQRDQAKRFVAMGDEFMKRVQYHANPDGSLSEQIDRNTGHMTSARDLTWSHSEVIVAIWGRRAVVGGL